MFSNSSSVQPTEKIFNTNRSIHNWIITFAVYWIYILHILSICTFLDLIPAHLWTIYLHHLQNILIICLYLTVFMMPTALNYTCGDCHDKKKPAGLCQGDLILCKDCNDRRFPPYVKTTSSKTKCSSNVGSSSLAQVSSSIYEAQVKRINNLDLTELKSLNAYSVVELIRSSMTAMLPTDTDPTVIANHALQMNLRLKSRISTRIEVLSPPQDILPPPSILLSPLKSKQVSGEPRLTTPVKASAASALQLKVDGPTLTASKIACIESCKLSLQNGKPFECSLCQNSFHRSCIGIKPTARPPFWICNSCKDIAKTVRTLMDNTVSLKEDITTMKTENATLSTLIHEQQAELRDLRQQVSRGGPVPKEYAEKLPSVPQQSPAPQATPPAPQATPSRVNKNNSTLLIGDSIIKGIDERGLREDIEVKCIRGARSADVHKELKSTDLSSYECIIVHVGTNDCSSEDKIKEGTKVIADLVKDIRQRAPDTKTVLSTVCPRTDSAQHDNRVSRFNDVIRDTAKANKCKVVENNKDAKDLEKSLLNRGGLHLSQQGTRKLLRNIHNVHGIIKRRDTSQTRHGPGNGSNHIRDNTSNYQRRPQHHHDHHEHNRSQRRCFFCGESNHTKDKCRHGRPISCNNCHAPGHKAHMDICPYNGTW